MDFEMFVKGEKLSAQAENIQISDRQGAKADDIRLVILNGDYENIIKGNSLEGIFGGFRSGKMNIDKISSTTTKTLIGAISTPVNAKVKRTRHWRKVRLFDIVNDIAVNCGLSVYYENIENFYYENVTQNNETDLAFLNRLCVREGYSLKVDDNRLVIYDKVKAEEREAVKDIGFNDIVNNKISFSENPNSVQAVTVKYFADRLISCTARSGTIGEEITINEYVGDEAEAERFSRGYLKSYTESETTVDAFIPITDGIASGNCVSFKGFSRYDGKYFVMECSHDPKNNQTRIIGRKVK